MNKEFTFSVNMSPRANFVTQSSIYDCPMLGRLTNRRIAKYQKEGRYNIEDKLEHQRVKKKKPKVNWLKELMNDL